MARRSRLRVYNNKRSRLVSFLAIFLLAIVLFCLFLYKEELAQFWSDFFLQQEEKEGSGRGTIFDRNYKELAVSLDRVSVYVRTREISSREEVAGKLAPLLGKDESVVENSLKRDSLRVWLAKNISQEQEEEVQSLNLEGVYLHREIERFYPQEEKAAHVVGFVEEEIGLAGVEYHYNKLLSEYGIVRQGAKKLAGNGAMGLKDGQYLVLTIDLKIQSILEKYLAGIAGKKREVQFGVILMDCKTGNILGNAMYPSYDPNRFRDYKKESLENSLAEPVVLPYAFRKIFSDAALLQAQYEKENDMLPWSVLSETGTLGAEIRLWERLQLDEPIALDFITKKEVGREQVRTLSVEEQEFDTVPEIATPLHVLRAVSGLVNNGKYIVPHVVDRFKNRWGEEIYPKSLSSEFASKIIIHENVSGEISRLIGSQMEKGPLTSGFLEDHSLFLLEKNGRQEQVKNTMMLTLIPAIKPEFIMLTSVRSRDFTPLGQGKKREESLIPSAKKIILPLVALQEVMKNLADMMTVEEREEVNYQLEQEKMRVTQRRVADDMEKRLMVMPDLRGLSLRKSLRILQDFELEIHIEGTGRILSQEPGAGTVIGSTKECRLVLEREYHGVNGNIKE